MSNLPRSLTNAAAVTIDMHRGHLDPTVATMPLTAAAATRVTEANRVLVEGARSRGLPVVHVVTAYHGREEIASNPWWSEVAGSDATRANVLNHQLVSGSGLAVMPEILDSDHDIVIFHKKRYDSFVATELDHVLRSRGVETLLLTGVNTNSCVLATTVAANARDYRPVVVSDCVDTMDPALHEPALAIIRQAFGWVATAHEILETL